MTRRHYRYSLTRGREPTFYTGWDNPTSRRVVLPKMAIIPPVRSSALDNVCHGDDLFQRAQYIAGSHNRLDKPDLRQLGLRHVYV